MTVFANWSVGSFVTMASRPLCSNVANTSRKVRKHRRSLDGVSQPKLVILELASDKNVVVDPKTNRVNGLLDYSTALWGDPFISDCFCNPTASFAEGFGRLPNRSTEERSRQYLYVLYHALLTIVRHRYRPSDAGGEMDARRNLTTAIRHLNNG